MQRCIDLRHLSENLTLLFAGFGKTFLLCAFLLMFFTSEVRAQTNPDDLQCGTILPTGPALDSLYNQHQRFLDTQTPGSPIPALGDRLVPVQFHIVRDDGCSGGTPEMDLLNELNTYVNPYYSGAGLFFVSCAPANFICSSDFNVLSDYAEGDALSMMYNVPNVLNIYVVENPAELCGWARFSSQLPLDYVVLANNCATNTSTMAHEIGHYFDLYHTHETAWGAELVDGTNCMTAGDLLCDTPADPVLFESNAYKVDVACMYTGTDLDGNGMAYMPDPSNLMSYSRKDCRDNFTPLQLAKAAYTAANTRDYVSVISCLPGTIEFVDDNCQLIMPDYRDQITFNAACILADTMQNPAPGTVITDLGFTMVTITVSTMTGEISTCGFYMTVRDSISPVFTPVDPDTILTNLQCEGILPDYRDSTMVTDNCDAAPIVTQEPPPGTNIGNVGTMITVYVIAEDESGNVDSLPIQVTVADSSPQSQLNCRDLNIGLDVNGLVSFELAELVPGANCSELHTLKIETNSGILVFQTSGLIRSSLISFPACSYQGQPLKATVTNQSGSSCWGYLTFKQGNGGIAGGRIKDIWCFDPLVEGGDIDDEKPQVAIPCGPVLTMNFVSDWITDFGCTVATNLNTPESDTAKIIYREYEVFYKGARVSVFDTLIVFRLPAIIAGFSGENTYCAPSDTTYCGQGFAGPFMIIPERCDPALFGTDQDNDGSLCDTIYFMKFDTTLKQWVANDLPAKCGLSIHLDQWVFGDECNKQYKFKLQLKQNCYGAETGSICGMASTDNAFEYISPNPFTGLGEPLYLECVFWLTDLDTLPPVVECKDDNLGLTTVYTSTHDCAAHTYLPSVYVQDDWSGIKQVKATIEGIGTSIMTYSAINKCYESHVQFKLPHRELPYKVFYEAYDSCHNLGIDSCYIRVKDNTPPGAVADKGVTVSLSDKKVWVDAESFDEGSWDNCGINFILARRSDWYEACVELCDSIDTCFVTEHHDILLQPYLETDKNLSPVEAHYAKTLDWFWNDNVPCGDVLYNAWQYDLMKYATLNCIDHPYDVDSDYFDGIIRQAIQEPAFAAKWKNPSTLFVGTSRFGLSSNSTYYLQMNGDATPVFDQLGTWGATTDFANDRILFTSSFEGFDSEGNILYALPFGGIAPVKLGRIKNLGGNDSIRIDGVAISDGVLYGAQQFDRAGGRGIYRIDLTTLEATLVLGIPGDPMDNILFGSGVGGIDADPSSGKIYGADDYNKRIIEIDIDLGSITKIADYPPGVIDIDGVAVGGGKIFLVPGTTGSVYVY